MTKYRKKPVEVEAFRLCKDYDGSCTSPEWFKKAVEDGVVTKNPDETVSIKTLEGEMVGNIGDYIIRGIKGEISPCKPDIFAATYDYAESTPPPVAHCSTAFKKYQSCKIVKAAKVVSFYKAFIIINNDYVYFLTLENGDKISQPPSLFYRGDPKGDYFYIIEHEDGDISWSPKEPFEKGYNLL